MASSVLPTPVGPTSSTRGALREDIFKMFDSWRFTGHAFYRQHICLPGVDLMFAGVVLSSRKHMGPFSGRNSLFGQAKATGGARFDLHEDGHPVTARDQIDFTVRRPGVFFHNFITACLQIFSRGLLTPASDCLVMRHSCKVSRKVRRRKRRPCLRALPSMDSRS